MSQQVVVAVAPEHLDSLKAICRKFGKGQDAVRKWREQGAPIAYDGQKYCAEYNVLMAWLVRQK